MLFTLTDYLDIRKGMLEQDLSTADDEDLKDFFVLTTCEYEHISDEGLDFLVLQFRRFEYYFPEYVQRGDALVKS